MNGLFQIIGLAMAGGITALTLKQYNPVFGTLTALAVCAAILLSLCSMISDTVGEFRNIIGGGRINSDYVKAVMKVIGISYITSFGSQLLRDSGENAVAEKCELAGKLYILYLTLPVIGDFLKMCIEIVEM